jgi:hypothetical protein
MNRLKFSCYADFFVRIFKTREENLPVGGLRNNGAKDSSLLLNGCPKFIPKKLEAEKLLS